MVRPGSAVCGRWRARATTPAKRRRVSRQKRRSAPLTAEQRRDLLELLDDRHGHRSTLVTSQVPVEHWHEVIGDPTLADAILDRLIHNAYRIHPKGESMRKRHAKLTDTAPVE